MEIVRDVVVAAIDERRLMVAQFYIESRENALRASEEKYRNSIDHAPDPMYEIDPVTLEVLSVNSAALELHHRMPYERDIPLVGQRLPDLDSTRAPAAGVPAYRDRAGHRLGSGHRP